MANLSENTNPLYQNCWDKWPTELCAFANACGLASIPIWLVAYVPQIVYAFRYKTVEGLSFAWIVVNFTASLNNSFFVFFTWYLPLYEKINAVLSPIIEFALIVQFALFSKETRIKKMLCASVCATVWTILIIIQFQVSVFWELEWVSTVCWCIESFPQIFLNLQRQSTQGITVGMLTFFICGDIVDFSVNILLDVPIQFVICTYFYMTLGLVYAVQAIWYWKQFPVTPSSKESTPVDDLETVPVEPWKKKTPEIFTVPINSTFKQATVTYKRKSISMACNLLRIILSTFLITIMLGASVAFVWRSRTVLAILGPLGICLTLVVASATITYVDRDKVIRKIAGDREACKCFGASHFA